MLSVKQGSPARKASFLACHAHHGKCCLIITGIGRKITARLFHQVITKFKTARFFKSCSLSFSFPTSYGEDEILIRMLLKEQLKHNQCEIVGETGDGESAIQLAAETQPDFICMDISYKLTNELNILV